jgi:hypothetical protein
MAGQLLQQKVLHWDRERLQMQQRHGRGQKLRPAQNPASILRMLLLAMPLFLPALPLYNCLVAAGGRYRYGCMQLHSLN